MKKNNKSGRARQAGPRSAARLGAVQALYQLSMSDNPVSQVIVEEYCRHRLGAEIEGDQYVDADTELFSDIVQGGWERRIEWDELITKCLTADWSLERLENVILAVLRAGAYEIAARPDVPTPVIINEYIDVAHAFYERPETAFINGILDRLAKTLR